MDKLVAWCLSVLNRYCCATETWIVESLTTSLFVP